jgi:hypothetical protein
MRSERARIIRGRGKGVRLRLERGNAMSNVLSAALGYRDMGCSIIPVKKNKKPFIPWEKYQSEHPSHEEIQDWWKKWPSASVAIVTGKISGLTVIDIDSEEGRQAIEAQTPDSFLTPTADSPRGGEHRYCQYQSGIANKARFLKGCDIRSDGGYIICPPSRGQNGKPYSWRKGLELGSIPLAVMPSAIASILTNSLFRGSTQVQHCTPNITPPLDAVSFDKGSRDDTLFRLANSLVKGGMPAVDIEKYLTFFAAHCNPPFPQKEVSAKIKSALKRSETQEKNLTQQVREWVSSTWGEFSSTFVNEVQHVQHVKDRRKVSTILGRLCNEGLIEKHPSKYGWYRRIDSEAQVIDFKSAQAETFPIKWPFQIEEMVKVHPKNVCAIAGEANSGKTALMLNIIKLNQNRGKDIYYFSSEMSAGELRDRLNNFEDMHIRDWNFQALERVSNFSDIIRPDAINLIDYLELSDNFYTVGGQLTAIFNKLQKGLAVVCLQKAPGANMGRGGAFGLEKPRLYMTVSSSPPDGAVLKILKAKNRANKDCNPNYMETTFKIVNGCKLIQTSEWK